jgi:hypothetical protein
MTALLTYPLSLSTYCDYSASFTWGLAIDELTSFVGASAQLVIKAAPSDPSPLLVIYSNPTVQQALSGQIYLGPAPPGPFGVTVADIASLIAYNASSSGPNPLVAGTLVAVITPTSYYAWSPGGLLIPDGVSIISGIGGQWLLSATIRFRITNAAMIPMVGTVNASYTLLVTWSDGTRTPFLEGPVLIDQSDTYP